MIIDLFRCCHFFLNIGTIYVPRVFKLNKHSILYEYQFGFRHNHSTTIALTVLIDRITHAMENGEYF